MCMCTYTYTPINETNQPKSITTHAILLLIWFSKEKTHLNAEVFSCTQPSINPYFLLYNKTALSSLTDCNFHN